MRNAAVQLLKDILLANADDGEGGGQGNTGTSEPSSGRAPVPEAASSSGSGGGEEQAERVPNMDTHTPLDTEAAANGQCVNVDRRPTLDMEAAANGQPEWPPKSWLPKTNIMRWTTPGPRQAWSPHKVRCFTLARSENGCRPRLPHVKRCGAAVLRSSKMCLFCFVLFQGTSGTTHCECTGAVRCGARGCRWWWFRGLILSLMQLQKEFLSTSGATCTTCGCGRGLLGFQRAFNGPAQLRTCLLGMTLWLLWFRFKLLLNRRTAGLKFQESFKGRSRGKCFQ